MRHFFAHADTLWGHWIRDRSVTYPLQRRFQNDSSPNAKLMMIIMLTTLAIHKRHQRQPACGEFFQQIVGSVQRRVFWRHRDQSVTSYCRYCICTTHKLTSDTQTDRHRPILRKPKMKVWKIIKGFFLPFSLLPNLCPFSFSFLCSLFRSIFHPLLIFFFLFCLLIFSP